MDISNFSKGLKRNIVENELLDLRDDIMNTLFIENVISDNENNKKYQSVRKQIEADIKDTSIYLKKII